MVDDDLKTAHEAVFLCLILGGDALTMVLTSNGLV